jgi:pseudaminic acid biosynthesis-associated methylase
MLTKEFWEGDFGDEYTKRNRVDFMKRVPFWRDIIAKTGATKKILEVGSNAGWNLSALRVVVPRTCFIYGIEINQSAKKEAENLGFHIYPCLYDGMDSRDSAIELINRQNDYDLVFTAGVLIHIHPNDLHDFMKSIINEGGKYILAVEYFAEEETEVEYRGHSGKLWKRNYGKLYQDMGLKLIDTGYLTKNDGFDSCTWWLLEKV